MLQIVAKDYGGIVEAARATDREADASPDHRLIVVSGNAHASVLLSTDDATERQVISFFRTALLG